MRRSLPALALVVAFVTLLLALPLAAQEDSGASPYVQGLAAIDQEKYSDAVKLLAQVVQQDATNEPAWFNLGIARFKSKPPDLPGALDAFRKALALAANRAGTRLYIGRIYEQQGAFAEAITMYEDEVTRTSGNNKNDAEVALGRVEYKAGESENAALHLKLAVADEPKYVEGLYWLGLAQTALEQYPEAVKTFRSAKNVLQDYADLKAGLGRMKPEQQRERKQTEEKLAQDYGRAQEFAQDLGLWPALNKALGDAYLGDKQYDMARVAYRGAMDKNQLGNPVDAEVQVKLAGAYLADAQDIFFRESLLYTAISVMRSAEKAADKAIELDAKSSDAYGVQGRGLRFRGLHL